MTGLLSTYHVIEEVTGSQAKNPQSGTPFVFRVMSSWLRIEGEDPQQEFDFSLVFRLSKIGLRFEAPLLRFRFEHRYTRFITETSLQQIVPEDSLVALEGANTLFVDSSIRPVGGEEWQTNSYPITLVWNVATEHKSADSEPLATEQGEPATRKRRRLQKPESI